MRRILLAGAVLAAFGAEAAQARGGGHGGAVHYVVVPVFRPGAYSASPQPSVELPMEITDAPVQRTEGVVGKREIIAHHTFRAMDAVVLLEPIQGRRGEIPAGTVLSGVLLHEGGKVKPVYCDLRLDRARPNQYQWDCFNDSNGIGKLDDIWLGKATDAFLGFATDPAELQWKRKLEKFAAYRKATPAERPTGLVGYSWCGGDGVSGPPRFTVSAQWPNGFWVMAEATACTFGQWSDPATKDAVLIDRITASFHPGPKPDTLAFKVSERIPAERIKRLQPNGGIRALTETNAEAAQAVEELKRPPFTESGEPPKAVTGPLTRGATFFSVGVRHSLTGVLKNEVRVGTYPLLVSAAARPGFGLTPGQVLYGARVGGAIDPQIVWCAPYRSATGKWGQAVCMPDNGEGNILVLAEPVMMGQAHLEIPDRSPPYVAEPVVERRAIDLPPMALSYAWAGWDKDRLKVEMKLDWGDGPRTFQIRSWPTDASGTVRVPVVGGEVLIARGAAEGEVSVKSFVPAPAPESADEGS